MEGADLGTYRVLSELGTGGMGKVWLAEVKGRVPGLDEGARVALKVVHPHLLASPGFFKRFLREAEIGKAVRHPNVVRTFDADAIVVDAAHHHFLVMEYVEGRTLRDLLVELSRVPEELCRHIGREVSRGLAAIHEAGVIHRDLKPENVLITPEHDVKIMDLGVARLAEEAIRLSQTGAFVGSVQYAAPEQFRGGGGEVDGRADLHAVGLILYELSTAIHPYTAGDMTQVLRRIIDEPPRPLSELNPQVSPFFEEVVHNLLAKDRDARFASASDLLGVLEAGEESSWWGRRALSIRSETRRPLRRIRIPRETAVFGRDAEIATLAARFAEASAGDGRVVLVEGEAGIGKTRLVDEFVSLLRQAGEEPNFLFGSYPPGGAATASGAWSTAYREHFGAEGLHDTLARYLTATPILIPSFAALLRGEPAPRGAEPFTKESIQTVFVHATRALAAERATIVLIEDLHFAPEEGRALFASLASAVPDHRILLVGTTRPGIPEQWRANLERLEQSSRIELQRLGPKDLVGLLESAFRSVRLAEELGIRIAKSSDGNPFFVFEIIRGLREGEYIRRGPDGTWVTTGVIREIAVPSTITDLVQARISDLDEEDRSLLEVASCCGYEFDGRLVGDVLGLKRVPVLKRLGALEKDHRLVRSAGALFVFDHHQIQESLYTRMPLPLREEYHALIGEALESGELERGTDPGDVRGSPAVDLTRHFLRGRRDRQTLLYLDAALDHLEEVYFHDKAATLSAEVLAVPGMLSGEARAGILLRQCGWLDLLGRREEQRDAAEEAEEIAQSAGDDLLLCRARRELGVHHYRTGELENAESALGLALDAARSAGDRRREATVLGALGNIHRIRGDRDRAERHYRQHRDIAREIGDKEGEATATGNLGIVRFDSGLVDQARECYERALELSKAAGDRMGETFATGNLGYVHFAEGRYEDARRTYADALAMSRHTGHREWEATALVNLGETLMLLGHPEDARRRIVAASDLATELGLFELRTYVQLVLGALGLERAEGETPLQTLEDAAGRFAELGDRIRQTETLLSLSAGLAREGDLVRAVECADEALKIAGQLGHPSFLTLAECRRAGLPDGDVETAALGLSRRESLMEHRHRMEARLLLWNATRDPGHLEEANRLLTEVVEFAPEAYHEGIVANVPLHREVRAAWEDHLPGS